MERTFDEVGRPEPPLAGDEPESLLGFLDYQRATLAWKCSGLDGTGLQRTVGASSITLGGLLKHMAFVEDYWFSERLCGLDRRPPWDSADWSADPDWDWNSAADDSPDELHSIWEEAVNRARSLVADSFDEGGLDQPARKAWPNDEAPSLRWILLHMIEEYARHNGHADLIRESIDGLIGE